MSRLGALFLWYGGTVAALLLLYGQELPGRWWLILLHLGMLLPAWIVSRVDRMLCDAAFSLILVPLVFSSLGGFLPELVPEPVSWRVQALDAELGGMQLIEWAKGAPAWLLDICQLCYSAYYLLPIVAGLLLYKRRMIRELKIANELIVGAFFLSYLGYFMFPVLPPYRFIDYGGPMAGSAWQEWLWQLLYELEPIRECCMPSGHTLVTLVTVLIVARWLRWHLLWLLPVAFFLVLGTMMLRVHWALDVVAALPFLALSFWIVGGSACGRLTGECRAPISRSC
ncbi:MAG: hypothetical protein CSA62_10795 [Planctomycetota bacterium]|nr:MAG: hypothetical protein CSA62_10795 [Planctomycetota bacterium]